MKIKALIPCKTDPCMMFSLPHHDPSSTYVFNQSLLETTLGNSYKPLLGILLIILLIIIKYY